MAISITVNLDDEADLVLQRMTTIYNREQIGKEPISPSQFLRQHVRDWIRNHAIRFVEEEQLGLRAAYKLATPEEQAQIDALLDKYRTASPSR